MKRGIFILCILFVLCFSFSVYSTEQDLAAYWNFDEGSGDIAGDSSGSGNNGYLGGAGVYVKGKPTWTTGIKNSALSFNGVNNYILVDDGVITATPNPSLDIKADQSFTISVWIKTSAFGKNMALLERYDGMPYHTLRISNNNKASFTIRGADGGEPSTSGGILLNDGNWHNVVAVRDVASDKLLIYIDGILETGTADTSVGDLGTLAMTFIGMSSGGTNYFEGLMDEYKIYKRALTANEIKSQYDSMFTSASNPLVYFDFEEVKNGFIEDLSGNGYNGVPNFYIKNNPTSSMLSQFGLTNFYPTGITDSNTDTYGWHTDSSTEGAYLAIDLGEGNTKKYRKARVHTVLGQPYKGIYFVQYSDDNINWINAATGFNPNGSGNGWQEKVWDYVGSHRYWRLYLTNTPGPGAWLDDLELYEESVTIVEGKIGKAIQFNPSTGDAINLLIPPINTQKDSKVTVEFWMYWDGTASNIPFGFETYHIIPSSTNLAFGTGANDLYGANINDLANRWVHIVAEFNNGLTSLNKLYINGVKKEVVYISGVAGASYKGQVTPSARISGWATSGALKLKGKIDEFRIYNGVLSEEDVLKHYEGKFGGLVASWNFDEESTTIALDSSGSKNNGEIKGPIKVEGIKGKALSFDGVNDYIDIGPGQLSVKKEMTLEAWFKTKSATGGGDNTFIYRRSGNYGVWLGEKEGKIDFGFWDQNTFYRAISSKTYNDDKWHYAVGTYDNIGDLKLYVDGIEVGYSPASGDIYYQSAYSAIGRNANENNRYWKGEIDEVKVYSKALTAEEIKKSYDETKPQSQEPIAYWNFDEGSGTIAADSSGNGNTGTLMNNPTWVEGIKGKALSFDGSNDYVDAGNPTILNFGSKSFSIYSWIKTKDTANYKTIVSKGTQNMANTDRYYMRIESSALSGKFHSSIADGTNTDANIYSIKTLLHDDKWHNVVMTVDKDDAKLLKIYIDGLLDSSVSISSIDNIDSETSFRVGMLGTQGYYFNGLIDEVKIYNRVLSDSEILTNYQNLLSPSPTCQTSCYWKVGNKVTGGNEQITVNSGTTVQAKADCLKNNDGNLLTEGTQVNFVVKDYDLLSKDDIVGQQISNVIAGSSTIDIVTNYVEDGEDQNELYFYIEGIEDCNSGDGANNLLYVNELGCVQDADCGAGQVCESGGCVPAPTVQCETSANCLVGENCVGGSCVASVCTSNNNCNVGEVCLYGVCNVVSNDNDMDGMPNDYETSHNLNPNNPNDAATDLDNDGITNLEEYLGNTDPIVPDNTGIATISEKTGSEVGSISSLLSKMELNFPVPKKYTITTTADNVDLSNLKSVDIYPSYEVEGQKVFCEDPVNVEIET